MLSSVQSLNFSFASSLASFATPKEIAEYASLRNAWHKRQEALIYQIAWSVKILLKVRETAKAILEAPKTTNEFGEPLTESNSSLDENAAPILDRLSRPFNLGILLVDIIPETSETWIWALLQFLITDKQLLTLKQIKVYSRRPKVDFDVSVPNAFKNITVSWTLCDIPTSDLLITNCLGMHHTLLDEIFAKMECPFTLMFPTTPGLTLARLVSLFKTDLVIMPRVDSSNDKSSIINESDQRV